MPEEEAEGGAPRRGRTCEGWPARLEKLREFKREHGHCDVPFKHPGGLGRWVTRQRAARRQGCKSLTPGRIQALDKEGFNWNWRDAAPAAALAGSFENESNDEPTEARLGESLNLARRYEEKWSARLEELRDFKRENGHCGVPFKYPGGLGRWVTRQRAARRQGWKSLTPSRIRSLDKEGFNWNWRDAAPAAALAVSVENEANDGPMEEEEEEDPNGAGRYEEKWSARLGELRDFKRENGHCGVPFKYPGGLGRWVTRQRAARRQGWKSLTPSRIRSLDKEGFNWNWRDAAPAAALAGSFENEANDGPMEEEEEDPHGAGRYEEKWSAWLGELRDFKREHGHCNVPAKHPGGLGNWVKHQRSLRRQGLKRLTPGRIRKLDEEGFNWGFSVYAPARSDKSDANGAPMEEEEEAPDGEGRYEEKWSARLSELRDFKREHGHCTVPARHPGGLGNWVRHQRSARRQGLKTMTPRRIRKLDKEGFNWEFSVRAPARLGKSDANDAPMEEEEAPDGAGGYEETWSARLGALREFKREHGHCNVPGNHPGGLGNWVKHQRSARRQGLKRMTPRRIRKLDGEGFNWGLRVRAPIGLGKSDAIDAPMEEEEEEDPNVEGDGAGIDEVAGHARGNTAAPAGPGGNKEQGNASKMSSSVTHTSSDGEEGAPLERMGEPKALAEPAGLPESDPAPAVEAHKGEMERRLSDIASAHRAQVDDLMKMHSEGLRGALEEYEGRLASLRGELEGLRKVNDVYELRLKSVHNEDEGWLRSVRGQLRESREDAKSLHGQLKSAPGDREDRYEVRLKSVRDEYEGQLRSLRDELREARENVTSLQGQLKSALGDPEVCVSF